MPTPEQALVQHARWLAAALEALPEKDRGVGLDQTSPSARAILYRPRTRPGPIYSCPQCWVKHGRMRDMRAVPGTDEYDVLRCNDDACGVEIILPID